MLMNASAESIYAGFALQLDFREELDYLQKDVKAAGINGFVLINALISNTLNVNTQLCKSK